MPLAGVGSLGAGLGAGGRGCTLGALVTAIGGWWWCVSCWRDGACPLQDLCSCSATARGHCCQRDVMRGCRSRGARRLQDARSSRASPRCTSSSQIHCWASAQAKSGEPLGGCRYSLFSRSPARPLKETAPWLMAPG